MSALTLRDTNLPRQFDDDIDWMVDASCKGLTHVFYPGQGENLKVELAKRICEGCPVRQPCLDYAVRNVEWFGVWGGMSENKRGLLRRSIRTGQT